MGGAAIAIVSLFDPPGGVVFSYLVIIKSMTHTHISLSRFIRNNYCNIYIYWQTSNTTVHYAFISSGSGPPPDYFPWAGVPPPADKDFFLWLLGFPDEEMVDDREARQPGGSLQGRGAPRIEYRDRQKSHLSSVWDHLFPLTDLLSLN
jgi:hypothetical protein